ncbi:hypothetical protein ACFVH7_06865 [Kitasatospora indigofera]|uniref:hypothetical protein n=1 Tax=Kitasatospora indigofera TaxID=67307 RepID=UPI00362697B5
MPNRPYQHRSARAAATAAAFLVVSALAAPTALAAGPDTTAAAGPSTAAVAAADAASDAAAGATGTAGAEATGDPHRATVSDPHLGPVHPRTLSPAAADLESCGLPDPAAWGWIGAGSDAPGAVTLNATVTDPAGTPLRSTNRLTDDSLPGSPVVATGHSDTTASGSVASFTVPSELVKDGHAYGWTARATGLTGAAHQSPASPSCHFRVDLTPPTVTLPAEVTDPAHQFPPSGNGQSTGLHLGQSGSLPFTAADADPSALGASGVACVRWGFDPQFADASWKCGSELPTGSLTVTPAHWGTNTTYIQVADNAGNHSQPAAYSYYVPDRPAPSWVYGDVTGDGVPDVLTADSAGNLRTYSAVGPTGKLAAPAGQGPGGSWGGVQVTHRSSNNGPPADNVFAHRDGSGFLNLYMTSYSEPGTYNRGLATTVDKPECVAPASDPDQCADYLTDFSRTLRIAATGGITLPDYTQSAQNLNRPGLLTVEANADGTDAALWFYPAGGFNGFDRPVRLAATGWKDTELITPGDWAGQGRPGLWTRDRLTGDVHALTFTVGTVESTDPFGDPTEVTALTAIAGDTVIGNVPVSQWSLIGSEGDLTGNGSPALWGVTGAGEVQVRAGHRTGSPAAPGFAFEDTVRTIGSTAPPAG